MLVRASRGVYHIFRSRAHTYTCRNKRPPPPPGGRMSPPTASASSRATSPATKWGTKWTLQDTKARRAGRGPKTACLIKPPAFQWCYSLWIERQARRENCGTRCNACVPSRRRHFVSHFVGSGAESASEVRRNMTATTCPEIVGFALAGLGPKSVPVA